MACLNNHNFIILNIGLSINHCAMKIITHTNFPHLLNILHGYTHSSYFHTHSGAACQHPWVHKWGPINTRQIQKFRAEVSTPRPHLYIICYKKLHSNLGGLEHHLHINWQPAIQPFATKGFHKSHLGTHGSFWKKYKKIFKGTFRCAFVTGANTYNLSFRKYNFVSIQIQQTGTRFEPCQSSSVKFSYEN